MQIDIKLPDKVKALAESKCKYNTVYGGRGSAKSMSVAIILILKAIQKPSRILCLRSVLLSINQSVHQLLKDCIKMMGVEEFFDIQSNKIIGKNGSEFIYAGLSNPANIKSYANVDYAFIEESDQVTRDQWETLIPTLRKDTVQFFIVFNPCSATDDTYIRFVTDNYYKDNNLIVHLNYTDNPFCPQTILDEAEMMKERDYDLYKHVYLGETKKIADDIVFRRVEIGAPAVKEYWDGPYYGLDYGYGGDDSNCLVKCYVTPDNDLVITEGIYKSKLEIHELGPWLDTILDIRKYTIRADSAMPLLNSHLTREGFKVQPVKKVPNSVEAGLYFIKSFNKIIIHPNLIEIYHEFKGLRWKTNKAGDILPETDPSCHDHSISAVRYAIQPLISGVAQRQKEEAEKLAAKREKLDLDYIGRPKHRTIGFAG